MKIANWCILTSFILPFPRRLLSILVMDTNELETLPSKLCSTCFMPWWTLKGIYTRDRVSIWRIGPKAISNLLPTSLRTEDGERNNVPSSSPESVIELCLFCSSSRIEYESIRSRFLSFEYLLIKSWFYRFASKSMGNNFLDWSLLRECNWNGTFNTAFNSKYRTTCESEMVTWW